MKHEARSTKSETNSKFEIQNSKRVWNLGFGSLEFVSDFGFRISDFRRNRAGITLLLVILVMSALLSVSIGIFDAVLGEFRISGEITDSFIALYAADLGIEKVLYDDRVADSVCKGEGSCEATYDITLNNGACAKMRLSRTGKDTTVISTGEYKCGSPELSVKRAFQASYAVKEEKGKKK